jgi:DNA ligase-associated metallophosphoesterase
MRTAGIPFVLKAEELLLLAERAIYWPAREALLVADLHIGKANHFRKHGVAVPSLAGRNNLWRLAGMLQRHNPSEIIFLGDLFHSSSNDAWPEFVDFLAAFAQVKRTLVAGNHDILGKHIFEQANMSVVDSLEMGPFLMSHDRINSEAHFNIHGHLHPGIRLQGNAKQRLRLPCFYFNMQEGYGVMPSFGTFTGLSMMKAKAKDEIFVCSGDSVIKVT